MKQRIICIIFIYCSLIFGCAIETKKQLTPLEIQNIQTREYEANKKIVFASAISVFQDLGYTIVSADIATGLISAESRATSASGLLSFFAGIAKIEQTKATVFIETINNKTRIRLNFVETHKSTSEYGQTTSKDTPIVTAELYENAFKKIESAIFIRNSTDILPALKDEGS